MKDYTQNGSPDESRVMNGQAVSIDAYQYAAEEMERMYLAQRKLADKLASTLRDARLIMVRFIGETGGVADAVVSQIDTVLEQYEGK